MQGTVKLRRGFIFKEADLKDCQAYITQRDCGYFFKFPFVSEKIFKKLGILRFLCQRFYKWHIDVQLPEQIQETLELLVYQNFLQPRGIG